MVHDDRTHTSGKAAIASRISAQYTAGIRTSKPRDVLVVSESIGSLMVARILSLVSGALWAVVVPQ